MDTSYSEPEIAHFLGAVSLLVRRVRSAVASNDLTLTQNSVLSRLAKEGPATTSDLARAERMKPQSMGTVLAELEGSGLVDRHPHPTDGRQVLVGLTVKGQAVRNASSAEKRTWLAEAVGRLEPAERELLWAAGALIRRLGEE